MAKSICSNPMGGLRSVVVSGRNIGPMHYSSLDGFELGALLFPTSAFLSFYSTGLEQHTLAVRGEKQTMKRKSDDKNGCFWLEFTVTQL